MFAGNPERMSLLGLVAIAIIGSLCSGQYHDGFTHMAEFGAAAVGRDVSVFWKPGVKDDDFIIFEIRAKTTGWMGLGFSPSGAMKGADLIVMWFDDNGKAHISDRHGPSDVINGYPPVDEQQDYEIVSANATATHMTFRIQRRMATCDSNDWKITMGTVHMLFAYNDRKPSASGELSQHTDKFSSSVRLIGPDDRDRVQGIFNSPDIYTTVDFHAGGVRVPGDSDTLYWCRMFELPKFDRPLQIVGHQMFVQAGNERFVHHMLLYGCIGNMSEFMGKPQSCYDGPSNFMDYCNDVYGGWAVGGQPYAYPNNMGLQYIGEEYDYFVAEFHYDNSQKVQNIVDNSSLRLYLTDKIRPISAGKLNLGSSSNVMSIVIPPQQERFTHYTYCPSSCSNNLANNTMTIMAGFLHTHLAGREIRVRHLRDGIELPPLVEDNYYDFNYQSMIIFPERVFKAGDEFIVECVYNTMDRDNVVLGGLSTHHEMCLALLEYYPRNRFLEQECMSQVERSTIPLALGASAVLDSRDPDTATIIDAQGRNRTYKEWVKTLDWKANNNELVTKLQNYVRDTPQNSICKINNATQMDDTDVYPMISNPKPTRPYTPPLENCKTMPTPTPGGSGRATMPHFLIIIALFFVFLKNTL